jgi:hypothetical protein
MRTQRQIVIYPSILEVLLEQGCPFCRFLKEYQTAHLQLHTEQHIHHLCSFHTWGLAAEQNGLTAAQVFMYPVVEPIPFSSDAGACDIGREVSAGEDWRILEFVSCIHRTDVVD